MDAVRAQHAIGSPLLVASGISKRYGANVALAATDFSVATGEAVAVLGENGAGKSTLAKILTGAIRADGGTVAMAGRRVALGSPRDALQRGIALIPQELAYVPQLTVAENIMLNRLPGRHGLTSRRAVEAAAAALMERLGLWVEPTVPMVRLGVSDQQIVEIVKALGRDSRLLILDEPTAALTEDEAQHLYGILDAQRAQGIGIVVVSHHLEQIMRFVDRVDVFRDGARVLSVAPSNTNPAALIAHMLGSRPEPAGAARAVSAAGRPILQVSHWSAPGRPGLTDVDVRVCRGEVVGVYGIRGSGAALLAEGLGGRRRDVRGTVGIDGRTRAVMTSPRAAIRAGISYVPADRKRDGLVLSQSIRSSAAMLVLRRIARWGVLRAEAENAVARSYAGRFRLRHASLGQPVGQLSGGNQQKVLLTSRLAADPRVLVAHEPTRGVDVGARREIHDALRAVSDAGTAVLVITSDVEEVVDVSDRVLVIRNGRIVAELVGAAITQDNAVHHAAAEEQT
ncbi:sugar ABC transporter ATP-binding protein [Nocardioides ginsengisoli]|uniref:Sugar ABC transporter ATP-binding protein n=1 Tax=Nocardioides ginsengisoli TaxID=363868 RepID=A0ABW3VZ56_9ACTN